MYTSSLERITFIMFKTLLVVTLLASSFSEASKPLESKKRRHDAIAPEISKVDQFSMSENFYLAVSLGKEAEALEILRSSENNLNPNTYYCGMFLPLQRAIERRMNGLVRELCAHPKINLDAKSSHAGELLPVLHTAAIANNLEAAGILLETKRIVIDSGAPKTALYYAAQKGNLEMVRFLMQNGALYGFEAMHSAIAAGSRPVVRFFVERKMPLLTQSIDGQSALHVAAIHGHLDLVKFFVKKCKFPVNLKDYDGLTARMHADEFGHETIKEFLTPLVNLKNEDEEDDNVEEDQLEEDGESEVDFFLPPDN